MKSLVRVLFLGILVMTVGAWTWGGSKAKELKPKNGEISIPVKDIDNGKAHYFMVKQDKKDIRFFVLKSSDGVIRAAFDACDVCYREKKGYSQSGEFMVCNNCGMRFHSRRINEVKGGCNPAPLNRAVEKNNLVIKTTDISTGAMFF